MEPMKPMEGMKPMKPMEPMTPVEKWWPDNLGEPSTSGSQNDMRYAFFPDRHRLLIDDHGTISAYDTGDHRISGVSQQQNSGHNVAFTSQNGVVDLKALKQVS